MRLLIFSLAALLWLAPSLSHAEMYRWVDSNGVTHYGDRVPPKYAKKRRERINEQGRIVGVTERELSPQEREAARAREARAAAEREAVEQRAKYDRSLTATYDNLDQLDSAYQDRLDIMDGKIRAGEKMRSDMRTALQPLYKRAENNSNEAGLDKRIKQEEQRLREQNATLERLREQRAKIEQRFEQDRQRYLSITGSNP